MPVLPRADSGGHSDSSAFDTGQFRPQAIEAIANSTRPTGAIRDREPERLGIVMGQPGEESAQPCAQLAGLTTAGGGNLSCGHLRGLSPPNAIPG
jgi:hypothetical protein